MADEQADAVKPDVQDAKAEPAPAEETQIPESSEITLEEFDADEKPAEKPKAEPKVETKPETEDKPEAEKPDEKSEAVDETPEPDKSENEPEKSEEPKPSKAEERKAQLNSEIRDLVAQRNKIKEEVTRANAETYSPASVDELTEQGMSETDAKVEALRQQMEMDKYNTAVAEAQLTIESEANRVINDFPIFNPESDSYDKELADEAAGLLQSNLITDENTGQIIGSNVSPYQLYKTIARAAGVSGAKGQLKGQQAVEKMMANADVSTNAAPPSKPKDPLMELWSTED